MVGGGLKLLLMIEGKRGPEEKPIQLSENPLNPRTAIITHRDSPLL